MGRGRAKAKQTKVARELKYNSHGPDLEALQRELAGVKVSTDGTHSDGTQDEYDDSDEDSDEQR